MSSVILNLIIQLVTGALGGNAAGSARTRVTPEG